MRLTLSRLLDLALAGLAWLEQRVTTTDRDISVRDAGADVPPNLDPENVLDQAMFATPEGSWLIDGEDGCWCFPWWGLSDGDTVPCTVISLDSGQRVSALCDIPVDMLIPTGVRCFASPDVVH